MKDSYIKFLRDHADSVSVASSWMFGDSVESTYVSAEGEKVRIVTHFSVEDSCVADMLERLASDVSNGFLDPGGVVSRLLEIHGSIK